MTPFEASQKLHEARLIIHAVAQEVGSHDVAVATFGAFRAMDALMDAINATVSRPVSACNLRVGDRVAISPGSVPDMTVAVAEYAPQGGCIAFRIGFDVGWQEGVYFMNTQGWRQNGIYSWSDGFAAAPEDAATISARPSLYHEACPEAVA